MRHTAASARAHAQSVYAELLRKHGASVNNEGNLYYNAKENFKNASIKINELYKLYLEDLKVARNEYINKLKEQQDV